MCIRDRYERIWGGGRSTLVNKNSKNLEGAFAFLEYMHGPHWNLLVNRQADALGPVMTYHYGKYEAEFLNNPDYPHEDYNTVWRTSLEVAEPVQVSPYVNGQTADRLLNKQTDLVWADLKPAATALADATKDINKAIIETLERDPELRTRYYEDLKRGARPAWDNPENAP